MSTLDTPASEIARKWVETQAGRVFTQEEAREPLREAYARANYGRYLVDPQREIRKLAEQGVLVQVAVGKYKYVEPKAKTLPLDI